MAETSAPRFDAGKPHPRPSPPDWFAQLSEDEGDAAKRWALFCAVLHYGLGNLSAKSVPPRPQRVIEAATIFEAYLNGEPIPPVERT